MARFHEVFVIFFFAALIAAEKCTNPGTRKAWYDGCKLTSCYGVVATNMFGRHKLSNVEKGEYITAVLCLMKKPAKLGLKGAKTRYDDFHAMHALEAYGNHYTV